MLYAIMYFFFTPLFLYIYLMLIFSHFTFDNDGKKSSKRQVTFIFLLKSIDKDTNKVDKEHMKRELLSKVYCEK